MTTATRGLTYPEAVAAALAWTAERTAVGTAPVGTTLTVGSATEHYMANHRSVDPRWDVRTKSKLRYVLKDSTFAATPLAKLTAEHIEAWRARLPNTLSKSTINRIVSAARAVLNAAAERHRRDPSGASAA